MPDTRLAGFAILLFALSATASVRACDGLAEGPDGIVAEVIDGSMVRLDSGIEVRLTGIVTPALAGRRASAVAEPLALEAKAALGKLVLGKPVHLGLDSEETDRYGRVEAQLFTDAPDVAWVQQAMVTAGFARAYALSPNRHCLDELIAAEGVARANGVGIWGDPYYSVRDAGDPASLAGREGHYELIEGDVVGTGEARNRVYLDFGRVWKDDVTAIVDQKAKGLFAAAGINPLNLRGKRVRIRGWLESRDGPLIELSLPEQIEVLSPK